MFKEMANTYLQNIKTYSPYLDSSVLAYALESGVIEEKEHPEYLQQIGYQYSIIEDPYSVEFTEIISRAPNRPYQNRDKGAR